MRAVEVSLATSLGERCDCYRGDGGRGDSSGEKEEKLLDWERGYQQNVYESLWSSGFEVPTDPPTTTIVCER